MGIHWMSCMRVLGDNADDGDEWTTDGVKGNWDGHGDGDGLRTLRWQDSDTGTTRRSERTASTSTTSRRG